MLLDQFERIALMALRDAQDIACTEMEYLDGLKYVVDILTDNHDLAKDAASRTADR